MSESKHRQMTNRQQQQQVSGQTRTSVGRFVSNRTANVSHTSTMNIPAIEITKETPSESVQPVESYSEEEFDQSMKQRVYGGGLTGKRSGISPMPPQRTRILSELEKSNFGQYNQMGHRRGPNYRDREHGVRWFIALFDYDPMTMSPNPDAAEEELPFQEGQLIKV